MAGREHLGQVLYPSRRWGERETDFRVSNIRSRCLRWTTLFTRSTFSQKVTASSILFSESWWLSLLHQRPRVGPCKVRYRLHTFCHWSRHNLPTTPPFPQFRESPNTSSAATLQEKMQHYGWKISNEGTTRLDPEIYRNRERERGWVGVPGRISELTLG